MLLEGGGCVDGDDVQEAYWERSLERGRVGTHRAVQRKGPNDSGSHERDCRWPQGL